MDDHEERGILIENERDALHILPLEILPLQTNGLKRARLIKNARLESVVELFKDKAAGSGQLTIGDLPQEFDWKDGEANPDMIVLRKVSELQSYDVYSLRVALRQHGIVVNDYEALQLSPEMNKQLTSYMTEFTRPLIQQIYGSEKTAEIETFEDVIALFRDPDVKRALENLKLMAETLGIKPDEVPHFIEDYGDIFLSLSYYRRCLDSIQPIVTNFLDSLTDIRGTYSMKNDTSLQNTVDLAERTVNELTLLVSTRFESFEAGSKKLWENLSAESFRSLKKLIESYHVSLGGVLCALCVKMDAWHRLFPARGSGGPQRRAEFIMTEMRQGLDRMRQFANREAFRIDPI